MTKAKAIEIVKQFLDKCNRVDCISAFATQIAYFSIMSAIPFIILLGSLLRYTPVTESLLIYGIEQFMPGYISDFVINIVDEVYNQPVGLVSIAAIAAVWAASKGIHCMVNGLNKVNDLKETRNWFSIRLRAMFFTLITTLITALLMVFLVFSKSIKDLIDSHSSLMLARFANSIMERRFVVLFIVLVIFFTLVYKFLPNRPKNSSFFYQLPGAIFSALAWYIFTSFLSIGVKYFGAFTMYGSMAAVIIIMFWLYVCLYIMLICAEINVYFEAQYSIVFDKMKNQRIAKKLYRKRKKQSKANEKINKKYSKIPLDEMLHTNEEQSTTQVTQEETVEKDTDTQNQDSDKKILDFDKFNKKAR